MCFLTGISEIFDDLLIILNHGMVFPIGTWGDLLRGTGGDGNNLPPAALQLQHVILLVWCLRYHTWLSVFFCSLHERSIGHLFVFF